MIPTETTLVGVVPDVTTPVKIHRKVGVTGPDARNGVKISGPLDLLPEIAGKAPPQVEPVPIVNEPPKAAPAAPAPVSCARCDALERENRTLAEALARMHGEKSK